MKTKLILLTLAAFLLLSSSAFAEYDTLWTKYTHEIFHLEFSNDDSKIMTVGDAGIIIFNTENGEIIKEIKGHSKERIYDAVYSPDETQILAARETYDNVNHLFQFIDIYDTENYELVRTIDMTQIYGDWNYSKILISPDGNTIVIENNNGINFVDYQTGETLKYYIYSYDYDSQKIIDGVVEFEYSKDGNHIIYTGTDGKLRFLNTTTYEVDYIYDAGYGILSISNDGSLIAFKTGLQDIAVSIMNTETKEIVGNIPGNSSSITGFSFSPDEKYFSISSFSKYNIEILNFPDLSLFKEYETSGMSWTSIDFTYDNNYIAASGAYLLSLFDFKGSGIYFEKSEYENIYPNPTTDNITISFILPESSKVLVNLYDANGLCINKIIESYYEQGEIVEDIKLSELSNGTYFIKIESLHFNKIFKLIIKK